MWLVIPSRSQSSVVDHQGGDSVSSHSCRSHAMEEFGVLVPFVEPPTSRSLFPLDFFFLDITLKEIF